MAKIRQVLPKGTLAVSDLLSEWELPIGGLQSKIIRRLAEYVKTEDAKKAGGDKETGASSSSAAADSGGTDAAADSAPATTEDAPAS